MLTTMHNYPRPNALIFPRDLRFCCDVDRSAFAMVGEVRDDHVVLAKVPC